MNEKMSFKMGAQFAASFYMGNNFLGVWHIFVNYNQCEHTLKGPFHGATKYEKFGH